MIFSPSGLGCRDQFKSSCTCHPPYLAQSGIPLMCWVLFLVFLSYAQFPTYEYTTTLFWLSDPLMSPQLRNPRVLIVVFILQWGSVMYIRWAISPSGVFPGTTVGKMCSCLFIATPNNRINCGLTVHSPVILCR